jgi:hypothetical protein
MKAPPPFIRIGQIWTPPATSNSASRRVTWVGDVAVRWTRDLHDQSYHGGSTTQKRWFVRWIRQKAATCSI